MAIFVLIFDFDFSFEFHTEFDFGLITDLLNIMILKSMTKSIPSNQNYKK